ncbi:very short patch repair endonuclease [Novosphingobium sp.]|uniref:very short patch repair endonuclease n=1 Tax=Novosphingobium sp. TaxID=1874826 RepID=UPI003BAB8BA1
MADIVPAEVRSRMMANIRGKNTKPELTLRKALHAAGFRYRLHGRTLPGKPDIVLSRYRAVIFVHGCFWHGHDCNLFRMPATRPDFWREKIARNRMTDARNADRLAEAGWRLAVVWECALRGKSRRPLAETIAACASWLRSGEHRIEIKGT